MKKSYLFFMISFFGFLPIFIGQTKSHSHDVEKKIEEVVFDKDSIKGFNEDAAWQQAINTGAPLWEQKMYVASLKRDYINTKYNLINDSFSNKGGGPSVQAACTNVDFETGTITGWTLNQGLNTNSTTQGGCCPAATTRYAVVGPGVDPSIPALSRIPVGGGNFALQLGDVNVIGGFAVRASQTFTVTAANSVFVYKYAVAMIDGGHTCTSQPYFNISFVDCSNNPIPCGAYNVVPAGLGCTTGGDPSFQTYVAPLTGTTFVWKDWTTKSFDLSAYIGQCVTIKFIASDCVPTGHPCWAYIDCACMPMTLNLNGSDIPVGQLNTIFCSAATNTLCAPPGFNSYSWTGPGVTGQTGQCINISTNGSYSVTLGQAGTSCSSPVLYSTFSIVPTPSVSIAYTTTPCQNNLVVPFQSVVNLNSGPAITSYSWDCNGDGVIDYSTQNASHTYTAAGTYTAYLTISNGYCTTTSTQVISVQKTPTVTVASASSICPGSCLTLLGTALQTSTVTNTPVAITSFTWSPAVTSGGTTLTPSVCPASSTTYTLTGTASNGCTASATVLVTVNPKPSATLTFTNPSCGLNNGIVLINNTTPALPAQTILTFASNLGSVSGQTVTGLGASTPIITLTNNFGCTFTISPTLTMTPGPTAITTSITNATCGNNNGSFTFGAPTGGTPAYTYAINNGPFSATSPTTNLAPGNYSVTVKDAKGCLFVKPLVISNIAGPTAILGTTSPASCAGPTGSYTVTGVTGGTATYSYSIDGGTFATTSVISGLATGIHSITVKDANGCTFPTTFSIGIIAGITSASVNASSTSCGVAIGTSTVVSVTGGVPAYTYAFDGGIFTVSSSTTGLVAGNHTVVIKDVNSCTLTVPYTVLSVGSPSTSITSFSNISCYGGSNGSFTVAIPTGGGGVPYLYTLASPYTTFGPTATSASFSGLLAGTYNITVRDAAGCISTASVVLTEPTPVSLAAVPLDVKCYGTATGTINLTGSGGTPAYTYNLNGGAYQASSVFANQIAATYIMGIKDAKGCLSTQTVIVNEPTALGITVVSQNANCTAANGFVSATVTGGTPKYTYTWTGGGGSAATSNNLVAGNYTVTAKDANDCVISSPAVIGLTPGGTAAITASTNITCNALCNGNLTAGMTGGSSPFTYSWSPGGQNTQTAINLCPGTYTCIITDFYGCIATTVGTITQPPPLTAIMNSNNVKCFGTATGTISAAGTGGVSPYTYLWPTLASTLATVPNVGLGTYSCNIIDANNCLITGSILVTQPTSLTLTSTITVANCNQANGALTINATGGTPAYTYSWSSGATTTSQSGLPAGTYVINVTDANNCLQTLAATIPNISGPTISISTKTNVSCFGGNNGAASVVAAGGTTPYIYSWSNGQLTPSVTNLVSGIYTVSVTDNAGCIASTSVNITQPPVLALTLSLSNPKCYGATNGYGIAAAIGGTSPYTYTWTGGAGNAPTSGLLGAGNYGISITDANGCVASSTMSLVNPPAMIASITSTNITCFNACNGIAAATSTNAIGIVGYSWIGGSSPISSQIVSGLCPGTYTMIATDQNNCTGSSIVTITQPTQLSVTIPLSGSVTCNGGNNGFASSTPAGGTPGYTYTWTPSGGNAGNANGLIAGNYTVTVTDSKSCTAVASVTIIEPTPVSTTLTTTNIKCNGGSDGTANVAFFGGTGLTSLLWQPGLQSGNFVNNLSAGNQTVTITTNGSCKTILTFTLTQPAPLLAIVTATNSNCSQANGGACATVGGGTAPLSYLWSNGITTLCNKNVLGGAYTFTVTDANFCQTRASGLVNDIAGPIVAVTGQTNVSCFAGNNGAATTTITGGVSPYSIFWSGNSSTTQNVYNFTAGLNNITVTDAAGCVGTAFVNITQPPPLVSAIGSFSNVTCNGLNNGQATMLVNGGTPNYNFLWTPSAQTSSVMINVGANTYTCTVTDANSCKTSKVVTISQPLPLITNSIVTNISCFGDKNGQISTTTQGGTPGYIYSWTPSQTNSGVIGGLSPGLYSLVITDVQNCSITANFNIIEPTALTSTSLTILARCGIPNGSATVTVLGGTPNYGYTWNTSTPQSGSVAVNMAPGNYTCTVTDANGCLLTQAVNIPTASSPIISSFVTTPPLCFGQQNGSIVVNYIGGTPSYSVAWSSPISQTVTTSLLSSTVVGVGSGAYIATVTDSYGCTTSNIVQVASPPFLTLTASASQTICFGQTAQIYGIGGGGTPPYSYTWTPIGTGTGAGPLSVKPNLNTVYTVSMTDLNGCSPPPKNVLVYVTPPLAISGYSLTKCDGDQLLLSPIITSPGNGGTSPLGYTYNWNNGATTNSIIVTASVVTTPNTYTVTIDDHCTIPTASAVFTVNVNPLPIISFTTSPVLGCGPLTVTLTGTSNGVSDIFSWQEIGLIGNPQILTLTDTGNITVTLLVTNPLTGCSSRLIKKDYIRVYPPPIASFYADPQSTSILDPTINFINTSIRGVSYVWDFGDPVAVIGTNNSTLKDPSHTYSLTGMYNVNLWVTSIQGCKATASLMVEITPDFVVYIPNCFTPDANGKNDFFQPMGVGIDVDNYRMDIFDRWGEEIFTSNNFYKGWDGTVKGGEKIAAQGVYIYKLVIFDLQGNKHPFVGHVTVLRQKE